MRHAADLTWSIAQGWLNVPSASPGPSARTGQDSTSPWFAEFSSNCCLSSYGNLLNLAQFRKFALGGGRCNYCLDALQDEREGVALLTRSDLGQGEGHRQGQEFDAFISFSPWIKDFAILELIKVKVLYEIPGLSSFFFCRDRRKGPGYQVVPSLQTLPPG
ncbi:hypothetical protein CEXT_771541 [Caerostris extrusa]|uniref:Uncharacterized protein n=1 Tax=Caerostris extrusa TaxID=172846 RepID=A0AAV4ULG9_CAEEX|nr:hypothetical protein CEXT_771541 [Caerostris extrusa]